MAHELEQTPSGNDPLLMIPGPSDVADDVLSEMSRQVVAHYGAPWAAYYNKVLDLVRGVLATEGDLFMYAGSGHLGLDAAIGSLFEPGSTVVVGCNGYFGERLADLAASHELHVVRSETAWGDPLKGHEIARTLDAHPQTQGVLVVHGETSTGILNPVQEIAQQARERGKLVVIDAVSSAGLTRLNVDAWGIDACVTASQKGLGAPPGVVLVTVSPHAWKAIDSRKQPIRGWSANLAKWREFAVERRGYQPYFITMPVNVVRALGLSLEAIAAEGLDQRFARHQEVSRLLREGLQQLGLSVIADSDYALPSVTTFRCPKDLSAQAIRDDLLDRAGILVSPGLGPWTADVVRIGHMGRNATPERIKELCNALQIVVHGESGTI